MVSVRRARARVLYKVFVRVLTVVKIVAESARRVLIDFLSVALCIGRRDVSLRVFQRGLSEDHVDFHWNVGGLRNYA